MKPILELKKIKMEYQIAFIIGIILLCLSIFLVYKNVVFLKNSDRAKGEVVELKKIHRSTSKPTFKPVFEFVTKDGKVIEHTSISSSNPPSWKVGEKAVYAYNSAEPINGKVVTFFGVFGWAVALACIALPLIIIGGGYYITQSMLNTIFDNL